MSIKIVIPSYLQPFTTNLGLVEVNGSSVTECLNHLTKEFPDIEKMLFAKNGALNSYVDIYVNGKDNYRERLAKPVRDGDELHIVYDLLCGG